MVLAKLYTGSLGKLPGGVKPSARQGFMSSFLHTFESKICVYIELRAFAVAKNGQNVDYA